MDTEAMVMHKVHQGSNIRRFRDILGVKQETLAEELKITQQAVSKLEQKEVIDDETLNKVAAALKIPVEALRNMNEESAFNVIANTFHSHDTSIGNQSNYQCSFNPLDKIVELYERVLKAEHEKVTLLQEALKDKK